MPEMHFVVRWPGGEVVRCYSPSLVVREHIEVGRAYAVGDFVARCRTMLRLAAERVRARYGFSCSAAMDELRAIETRAERCDPGASVTVVAFELPHGIP